MSVQGIDFANLTLRDALDLAILIEAEAEERYLEFAHQMEAHHSPEPAGFFRVMAANEAKHGTQLAARRRQCCGDEPRSVTRAMLWDVEAPDYDEARAFMSARQAMQSALKSEEKAFAFFDAALPQLRDESVAALFAELRAEEVVHRKLVQAELDKLPDEPEIDGDAFGDEPTAQ